MVMTITDAKKLKTCLMSHKDLSQLEAWGMFQWQPGTWEDPQTRDSNDPSHITRRCGAWRVTSDPSASGEGYLEWGPLDPLLRSYTRAPCMQRSREPAARMPLNEREDVFTSHSIASSLSQNLIDNPYISTQNKSHRAEELRGSLCTSCANTPFSELLQFKTVKYKLVSNLSTSRTGFCKLCQMVDEAIGASDRSGDRMLDLYYEIQSPVVLRELGHVPHVIFDSRASMDVTDICISTAESNPSLPSVSHPTGSLAVLPEAGSRTHFSLLRHWLQQCHDRHDHNSPYRPPPPPSRLIDISDPDNTGTLYLRDGLKPGTKYVALSHCWGKSQPAKTTRENLNARRKGIQFPDFPRTFQDAVTVTRSLGINYLWIDSLCIVQDDPDDWQLEAKRMEDVFSFAHCTISATSASGCDEGFLQRSTDNSVRVPSSGANSCVGVWFTKLLSNFEEDVERSILNQRAWVFQERALSRRNLHFTASQTYFQCENGVWCETTGKVDIQGGSGGWCGRMTNRSLDENFPRAMAISYSDRLSCSLSLPDSIFPVPFPHLERTDPTEVFERYLSYYSRLAISKQSDRPFAILGLESRLAVCMGIVSLYGVLIPSFCRTLFWHRRGNLAMRRINFPHDYVPSWSWMCYEGAVDYGMLEGTIPFNCITWGGDIRLNNAGMIAPVQENRFCMLVPVSLFAKDFVVRRGMMQEEVTYGGEVVAWIRFDDPDEKDLRGLRSVIVGQASTTLEGGHSSLDELQRIRSHWSCVLHVRPFYKGNQVVKETYQRVGVGIVRTEYLSPDKQVDRVWVV